MATLDSWQQIFDKAGDLVDSLLYERPKDQFDAIDDEEKIISVLKEIASGEIDPREDWSVIIKAANKGDKLDEKIDQHFEISFRQAIFVRILFEYTMKKIKENYSEHSQFAPLMKAGEEMIFAFACAHQHATAWRLLIEVRDKSYEARSSKGAQVKAEKKEEREVLLHIFIESALERLRPGGGWRNHIIASQTIAKDLAAMAESYSLPITNDIDELSEKVQSMVFKEDRLRKAYNEAAKKPLDEPVKIRKAKLNVIFGEEDKNR